MSREEIIAIVSENIDKSVRVTFEDGETETMLVSTVDDEGFVNKIGDEYFWCAFDVVCDVQAGPET